MTTTEPDSNSHQPAQQHGNDAASPPPKVVYGYVRVVRGDIVQAAALKADLLEFCHAHGYMRGTVFVDWGVEDTAIARPSFASLLDVCGLVGGHGVVVPARRHLSGHAATLDILLRQLERTGVTLIVADEVEAELHGAITAASRPSKTREAAS
jgi:DNA invertase Pin-like site-specific DNA recombinase